MEENKIVVFKSKQIRRIRHEERWYFSIVDVCEVLTDSPNPRKYWSVLKTRLKKEGNQPTTICSQLKMQANDGKMRLMDCADTEGLFRIIQSIPSPKAEPFKRWLAKVGYERVQEIENPELAQQRMKQLYEQKGYPKDWIDKRLRGIAIRQNLTDEWKERGIDSECDYAILTAWIWLRLKFHIYARISSFTIKLTTLLAGIYHPTRVYPRRHLALRLRSTKKSKGYLKRAKISVIT